MYLQNWIPSIFGNSWENSLSKKKIKNKEKELNKTSEAQKASYILSASFTGPNIMTARLSPERKGEDCEVGSFDGPGGVRFQKINI